MIAVMEANYVLAVLLLLLCFYTPHCLFIINTNQRNGHETAFVHLRAGRSWPIQGGHPRNKHACLRKVRICVVLVFNHSYLVSQLSGLDMRSITNNVELVWSKWDFGNYVQYREISDQIQKKSF